MSDMTDMTDMTKSYLLSWHTYILNQLAVRLRFMHICFDLKGYVNH